MSARTSGATIPASHRSTSHIKGVPPKLSPVSVCHPIARPAAETKSRNPAADAKQTFAVLSGAIDIVGEVRYQCPSSIPTVALPIVNDVASSEKIVNSVDPAPKV